MATSSGYAIAIVEPVTIPLVAMLWEKQRVVAVSDSHGHRANGTCSRKSGFRNYYGMTHRQGNFSGAKADPTQPRANLPDICAISDIGTSA
jgi:hypothetical protein